MPSALEASGESLLDYVERHVSGDWGDLKPEDRRENEFSLKVGRGLCRSTNSRPGSPSGSSLRPFGIDVREEREGDDGRMESTNQLESKTRPPT